MDKMENIVLRDGIKKLVIEDKEYKVDVNDFDSIEKLTDFKDKYEHPRYDQELLDDCKDVIDTILGKGTYDDLFPKRTMKAYLLVNELANIYIENFAKEEREKQVNQAKEMLADASQLVNTMDKFKNTLDYLQNGYGMRNYVSKKSSKKHKHKRN